MPEAIFTICSSCRVGEYTSTGTSWSRAASENPITPLESDTCPNPTPHPFPSTPPCGYPLQPMEQQQPPFSTWLLVSHHTVMLTCIDHETLLTRRNLHNAVRARRERDTSWHV